MLGKIWCSLITVTFTLLIGCVPQPKPVDKFDINKLLNVTDSEQLQILRSHHPLNKTLFGRLPC